MGSTSYDIVIGGGGITGLATAYFLAANSDFVGKIAIIEPDATYQYAATPRSAGGIRQQFSTPENIRISQFTVDFIREAPDLLSVGGERPPLSFHEQGYLFLAPEEEPLRSLTAMQQDWGAATLYLNQADLKQRFGWLRLEDVKAGSFGQKGEGWIDPYALLQAFRRKIKAMGVDLLSDSVANLKVEAKKITAVECRSGARFACGSFVNQSGIQAPSIAAIIGLDLPVRPRKRCVYVFTCREKLPQMPLCIDPSGVWWRPEGETYICGLSPEAGKDPDTTDFEIEYSLFEDTIWPILAHRVPAFEAIKLTNAWAGHYDYNIFDQNVLIGPAPEIANFHFANGFSGHGLQQAPAIGRALSEWIVYGEYRTLDLSAFSYSRFLTHQPIREMHVV